MAFQKGNWTHTTPALHARVYLPAAIPNTAINFGQVSTLTLTVPFQFQGSDQLQVTIPTGQPTLNAGLDISSAQLLAPATGSYSAGNHPRIQFSVQNSTNATNYTPGTTDLFAAQY